MPIIHNTHGPTSFDDDDDDGDDDGDDAAADRGHADIKYEEKEEDSRNGEIWSCSQS